MALFIGFVLPYYNKLVDNMNIQIGSSDIKVAFSVTNLGVKLDMKLKMTAHTSHNELIHLSTKASQQYLS